MRYWRFSLARYAVPRFGPSRSQIMCYASHLLFAVVVVFVWAACRYFASSVSRHAYYSFLNVVQLMRMSKVISISRRIRFVVIIVYRWLMLRCCYLTENEPRELVPREL